MQGVAKSILITILVSICFMLFTNLIFFFPWYMTLVIETFNLSQAAANDNYIKTSYYEDTLDRLQSRPIFNQLPNDIVITVKNADGSVARGYDDESYYKDFDSESMKPYRQRGKAVNVKIEASYPLSIKLWGREIRNKIPVSFSLTAIGLKHYKDLEFIWDRDENY